MVRFMLVTFAFLAWLFYVMSGGAEFDPDRARAEMSKSDPLKPEQDTEERSATERTRDVEVTRVSLNLNSVEDVLNGTDGTDKPASETGRRTTPPVIATTPQVESIEVVPSLSETATASVESDDVLPSLIQGASPETDTPSDQLIISSGAEIRVVTGSRVNVRGGPGTDYAVVSSLTEGERVEVLEDPGTGWVRMRPADGGTVGWMADFLLSGG